jgi:glucuronoarabinoxylan endo-1,4-beta-xylanase
MNKLRTIFIVFVVVTLSVRLSSTTQADSTITINWNEFHQPIEGFGASSAWRSSITASQADMFFSVENGIGLSLLRNHINTNGTTSETSIMQQAVARGVKVWSTPWSPPASWKDNNNVNNGGYLMSSHYQDYANQLAAYVANMKSSGVPIYAISIQNEPDLSVSYESCLWTSQQFHDFVPYLFNALVAKGVADTKIIVAEESHWYFDLTSSAMSDSNTASMVGILAAHGYSTPSPGAINTNGKSLWETETSTFGDSYDGSISNALTWATTIHNYLVSANVNAWHYWWLISSNADNEGLTDTSGNPAKRMYALGNFSKFVRPGHVRIGTSGSASNVSVSAYKDRVSDNFAIVAINNNSSAVNQTFSFTGIAPNSVTPWVTSATLSLAQQSAVAVSNGSFTYTLPASSIVTFVGQNPTASPAAPKNLHTR